MLRLFNAGDVLKKLDKKWAPPFLLPEAQMAIWIFGLFWPLNILMQGTQIAMS